MWNITGPLKVDQAGIKFQAHTVGMHGILVLDGSLEPGTCVRRIICDLICSRRLIRSREGTNWIFFLQKDLFSFMDAQHVQSYHLI